MAHGIVQSVYKYLERDGTNVGKKVTCTISRNGDLINKIYLQVQFPALSVSSVWQDSPAARPFSVAWTNAVGHALIRYVTIEVGGQKIDSQYGDWLEIWNALTQVSEKENGYNHMVGLCILALKSSSLKFCRNKFQENDKNSAIMIECMIQMAPPILLFIIQL